MEVILLERIARLGGVGDVVRVRDGFGRNYLVPNKKALRATEANKKVFEEKRHVIEEQNAENKARAEARAGGMKDLAITLVRQASEEGKLYGSVTVRDIAESLAAAGHDVPRSQIVVTNVIKSTGAYPVRIALHPEVTVTVTLTVSRTDGDHAAA